MTRDRICTPAVEASVLTTGPLGSPSSLLKLSCLPVFTVCPPQLEDKLKSWASKLSTASQHLCAWRALQGFLKSEAGSHTHGWAECCPGKPKFHSDYSSRWFREPLGLTFCTGSHNPHCQGVSLQPAEAEVQICDPGRCPRSPLGQGAGQSRKEEMGTQDTGMVGRQGLITSLSLEVSLCAGVGPGGCGLFPLPDACAHASACSLGPISAVVILCNWADS